MKKQSSNRLLDFFAGKGFYVILFVCLAAIGISGYALLFSGGQPDLQETSSYLDDLNLRDTEGNLDWDIKTPPPAWEDDSELLAPPSPVIDASDSTESAVAAGVNVTPPDVIETAPSKVETAPTKAPEETPKPKPAIYLWPVTGKIIVSYSKDDLVFCKTMNDWRVHLGIDIETPANAKISAVRDGTVEDVYDDPMMGTTVVIAHDGDVRSVYSNLNKIPTVAVGDTVKAGTTIGAVGNTALGETAETHHLHLEVFKGDKTVDPLGVLPVR